MSAAPKPRNPFRRIPQGMAKTATQQTSELTGDFMKDIAGRHKLSDNLGAARYWADENGVPMPDRSLSWLRFLSVVGGPLGLDHIYLRSPVTGFIKLITFGGFGLWWLWDTLQVFLEKERVIKYGLTAPFDIPMKILTGVGQGMITDRPSGYKSKASFPFYILATLLGFTGLDSLVAGKFGLAIRRFVDFGYFGGLVTGGAVKGGSVIAYFFAAIAGFFVLVPYFTNLWGLVTGYANDVTYNGLLDWYMQVYDGVGPKVSDSPDATSKVSARIQELFGYTPISHDAIRKQFAVVDPYLSKDTTDTSDKQEETGKKPKSNNAFKAFFWGSPIGVFIYAIVSFVGYFIPGVGAAMDGVVEKSVLDMSWAQIGAEKTSEAIANIANAAKETVSVATEQAKAVVAPALNAVKEQQAAIQAQVASAQQAARNVTNSVKEVQQVATAALSPVTQTGGGEPLSYEAKILGATVGALIIGGGIKGVIDHLMSA